MFLTAITNKGRSVSSYRGLFRSDALMHLFRAKSHCRVWGVKRVPSDGLDCSPNPNVYLTPPFLREEAPLPTSLFLCPVFVL